MKQLVEYIHDELIKGKTIAQIKKDIKQSKRGWNNREVSKAIQKAVKKELEARGVGQKEDKNAQVLWMWAIVTAIAAVVILAALWFYLLG